MTNKMKNVLYTYSFISETVCYLRNIRKDLSLSFLTGIINDARECYTNGHDDDYVVNAVRAMCIFNGECTLKEELLKLLVEDGKWLSKRESNPEIPFRDLRFYPGLYYLVESLEGITGSECLTGDGLPLATYRSEGVISGMDKDRFIKSDPYLSNRKLRITPLYPCKGGWSVYPC